MDKQQRAELIRRASFISEADRDIRAAFVDEIAQAAAQPPNASGRMSKDLRDFIEGMSVSVDVSTGDHDADHRLFGTISEVMDEPDSKNGVILLMHDQEPNFEPPSASDERERMIAFLMGESEIDGVAFGERHPTERGAFWWRNRLRAALAPSPGVDAAKPVAVVGEGFALLWAGSGPIAPLVERHGVKVGSKLYSRPAPSPAASADEWMAEATRMVFRLMQSANVDGAGHRPHVSVDDAKAALLDHLAKRPAQADECRWLGHTATSCPGGPKCDLLKKGDE